MRLRAGGLPVLAAGHARACARPRRALQDALTAIRLGVPLARAGHALFSNGERFQKEFLNESGESLMRKLKTIDDHEEIVRVAFRNVLVREPDVDELRLLGSFLDNRSGAPQARQDLVWALLTSSELRFNY